MLFKLRCLNALYNSILKCWLVFSPSYRSRFRYLYNIFQCNVFEFWELCSYKSEALYLQNVTQSFTHTTQVWFSLFSDAISSKHRNLRVHGLLPNIPGDKNQIYFKKQNSISLLKATSDFRRLKLTRITEAIWNWKHLLAAKAILVHLHQWT